MLCIWLSKLPQPNIYQSFTHNSWESPNNLIILLKSLNDSETFLECKQVLFLSFHEKPEERRLRSVHVSHHRLCRWRLGEQKVQRRPALILEQTGSRNSLPLSWTGSVNVIQVFWVTQSKTRATDSNASVTLLHNRCWARSKAIWVAGCSQNRLCCMRETSGVHRHDLCFYKGASPYS